MLPLLLACEPLPRRRDGAPLLPLACARLPRGEDVLLLPLAGGLRPPRYDAPPPPPSARVLLTLLCPRVLPRLVSVVRPPALRGPPSPAVRAHPPRHWPGH